MVELSHPHCCLGNQAHPIVAPALDPEALMLLQGSSVNS